MDDLDFGTRTLAFQPGDVRHQVLYRHLRDRILSGYLRATQKLPPTRVLARDLGLARGTVALAYEQLKAEGYAEARVGAGTFVADVQLQRPVVTARAKPLVPSQQPALALRAAKARPGQADVQGASLVPFRAGTAPLDLLPRTALARIAARIMRTSPMDVWGYGPAQGEPQLREVLAAYLRASRGLYVEADRVIITSGTQQALWLMAHVLADPGETVWMEDPGYWGAVEAFERAGLTLTSVPVDGDGLCVDEALRRAPTARLAYVTPTHQFPLGATLSLARRLALLRWAEATGGWIIEDDYDGAFCYRGAPLEPLYALDTAARVLYVGSLSKVLAPAFRIGYIVAPPDLVQPLVEARTAMDRHAPAWMQRTVAAFIEEGHFGRHVRRLRKTGWDRQQAMLAAGTAHLSDVVKLVPSDTGLHLVGFATDPSADDAAMSAAAQSAGLCVKPLSMYYRQVPARRGWVFGYAPFAPADLAWAAQRLGKLWSAVP
ncbi:MAG: PLP-dependent aminotransferase family protein [Bacteroidota bacterium]